MNKTLDEARALIKLMPDLTPQDQLRYALAITERLVTIATELHLKCEAIKAEIERLVPNDIDDSFYAAD